METSTRINKYLAQRGYTTRRGADELIATGKVFINSKRATLGQKVTEHDTVEVRDVAQRQYRYYIYNKPRGVITHSPRRGERDIAEDIQKHSKLTGLFPVGRLDKQSEGLILLTDDGRITSRLLEPTREHEREYEVVVDKKISNLFIKHARTGINIEGYTTKPATVSVCQQKHEHCFRITLTEGKKHQLRRMCAAFGYQVLRLKRIRIMHLHSTHLKTGSCRPLTETERMELMRHLKLA